jgi:hypothetical protein
MNERIQKLADVAYKNHLERNPHSSFGRRSDYDKEFAELIVRECLDEIQYDDGATHVDELLPKHFGFEL